MSKKIVNQYGGKQSDINIRFDLVPQDSLREIAKMMQYGAVNYGVDNWKRIERDDHINHALNHLNLLSLEDDTEDHLSHAMVRLVMAYHVDFNGIKTDAVKPDTTKQDDSTTSFESAFAEAFSQPFPFFSH